MTKIKLIIKGMHCASCATNVERSLSKVPGVKSVNVSLLTHKAVIESENAKEDDLKKAVSRTGYSVVNVEK
jgi:Cu+-exporting ATPase